MNNRYLLEHIQTLEKRLKEAQQKEEKLKKVALNIKKLCQSILDISSVNNDKKMKITKYINSLIGNLEIEEFETFYKDKYLNRKVFFEIASKLDMTKHLIFIFRLRDSKELEFASSFIDSKFTPYFFIDINKIIGIIPKDKLKDFENTKFIPFFKEGIYNELHFFVIFFEMADTEVDNFQKALNLYDRFYLKPSMSDKHYVHYSLIEDKIIDFELIEKEKIKKEFAYVNDLTYPEIENLIRKEIKNIRFILALLDRIDTEIKEIKKSKGRSIVVKRILSFIHKHQLDEQIQEMCRLISQELEKEEYVTVKR